MNNRGPAPFQTQRCGIELNFVAQTIDTNTPVKELNTNSIVHTNAVALDYSKFLHNISSVLVPLHKLLKKGAKSCRGKERDTEFNESKILLTSPKLLIHYDARKRLISLQK